jgi:hypothetical protein
VQTLKNNIEWDHLKKIQIIKQSIFVVKYFSTTYSTSTKSIEVYYKNFPIFYTKGDKS